MAGPAKSNPANTTGVKLGKDVEIRPPTNLTTNVPKTDNEEMNQYLDQLHREIQRLTELTEIHEQKLNRMHVDPVTHVVTFIQ